MGKGIRWQRLARTYRRRPVRAPTLMNGAFLVLVVALLAGHVLLLPLVRTSGCLCVVTHVDVPRIFNGEPVVEAPMVQLTRGQILLDGLAVDRVEVGEGPYESVLAHLKRKRELWKTMHPTRSFPGHVILEIDKDTPMGVVKRIMHSAALAGYPEIDFIGIQMPT